MLFELAEVEARELRGAAYHEAAHKVICERFGGRAEAYIWRNESGNENEKAWLGTCGFALTYSIIARRINAELKAAGLPPFNTAVRRVRMPAYAREYIGMAGMIAELLLDDPEGYGVEDSLYFMIQDGASETDLEGMGVSVCEDGTLLGWRGNLVKTGIRMVREEWVKIAAEAERLIAEVAETANEFANAA